MKLKEWARVQGVSCRTALNWFHAGTVSASARQLPIRAVLVESSDESPGKRVAYCRVCLVDQRGDLERRVGRVAGEAGRRGIGLDDAVIEIGSGLDGDRVTLRRLLSDQGVMRLVVEYRDGLACFGVEHREAVLAAAGREIVVWNTADVADDVVRDVVEGLSSVCARVYGRRCARCRGEAAARCAAQESWE